MFSLSSPSGVDLPQPRWSKRTTRQNFGSKNRRCIGEIPAPGPPWKKMTGAPPGLPDSSTCSVWSSETGSRNVRYGSISGKSGGMGGVYLRGLAREAHDGPVRKADRGDQGRADGDEE